MSKIETTLNAAQVKIAEALFGASYGVTLGKRSGDTVTIPVPVGDMPENAIIKIFEYGVQRIFNDKVGGADTSAVEKADKVRELIEAFTRGEIRAARTGASVDPVLARAHAIIRPAVKKAIGAEAWKALSEDERAEKLAAVFDAQPDATKDALFARANEELAREAEERKARAALSIDVNL